MGMDTGTTPLPGNADRSWYIVGRWLEYEGESRANVLRLIAIAAFYVVELINYHGLSWGAIEMPQVVDRKFHMTVTSLAVAWTLVGLIVLYCQSHHFFHTAIKYISTGLDVVFLTFVLVVASGPQSPLLVGYFLLIALSALRFNLPLVWFTTLSSMAGYIVLTGYAKWYATGSRVPRYHQLITLLALALLGIIVGQVIRRVRGIAADYAQRAVAAKEGA
jgi:hypothetical protein